MALMTSVLCLKFPLLWLSLFLNVLYGCTGGSVVVVVVCFCSCSLLSNNVLRLCED